MENESIFTSVRDPFALISREVLLGSLIAAGEWLLAAADAAARDGRGAGYRDVLFFRDGSLRWLYPHSNMGEQVESFLMLWEVTGEERFRTAAVRYASRMLDDPERGLYRGPVEEAHGLVYYWRDVGSYTGMYSMRALIPFYRLYELTAEPRWLDAAKLVAEPLLRAFTPSGVSPYFAWMPQDGFVLQGGDAAIGSRAGMLVGVYAFCAEVLQDARAEEGLERLRATLGQIQLPSGAFPQGFTLSGKPEDASIKNHFHGYLLNGLTTALHYRPGDVALLEIARRLVAFSVAEVRFFGGTPYCATAASPHPTDQAALFHPVSDPAPGLIRYGRGFDAPEAVIAAKQIIAQLLLRQVWAPGQPGMHGALPTTNDPATPAPASLKQYAGVGVPHLEENPERLGVASSYYINQYIQAGCLLLKA